VTRRAGREPRELYGETKGGSAQTPGLLPATAYRLRPTGSKQSRADLGSSHKMGTPNVFGWHRPAEHVYPDRLKSSGAIPRREFGPRDPV